MSRFKPLAKPWIVMPLVALLALAGWGVTQSRPRASAATRANEQVVEATTGTVAQTVSAQGTVAAARTEDLRFPSAGTVTTVTVKAGQKVSAGDVLAQMDSSELQAALREAEAALAQAEAKLADDIDADASSLQLAADRSSVATAEGRVAQAKKALDGAKLVAPIDGVIAQVNIAVGEELGSGGTGGIASTGSATGSGRSAGGIGSAAGAQQPGAATTSTAAAAHVQVVTPTSFTVAVGIDGNDIDRVKIGQKATISLSTSTGNTRGSGGGFLGGGFPGGGGGVPGGGAAPGGADTSGGRTVRNVASVTGKVTAVSVVADASSGVAKYAVTVAFEDNSGDYNPGATVDVRIAYAEKQNAVQVPLLAVSTENGRSAVTVAEGDERETRTVTTGLTSGNMIEITEGLRAGERVVMTLPTFPGAGGRGGGGQMPGGGTRPNGAGQ